MAAGALIRDVQSRILIVKPTYRPEWLVPGGSTEANESPRQCAIREVEEEIGIRMEIGRLLCVEYQSQRAERTENLQFIFDGGLLHEVEIAKIKLPEDELSDFRLAILDEALTLLAGSLGHRIALSMQALIEGNTLYIENGVLIR